MHISGSLVIVFFGLALVVVFPPTAGAMLFGLVARLRREHPDACGRCRYRRTGLTPDAPCPECGLTPDDAWRVLPLPTGRAARDAVVAALSLGVLVPGGVLAINFFLPGGSLRDALFSAPGIVALCAVLLGARQTARHVTPTPRTARPLIKRVLIGTGGGFLFGVAFTVFALVQLDPGMFQEEGDPPWMTWVRMASTMLPLLTMPTGVGSSVGAIVGVIRFGRRPTRRGESTASADPDPDASPTHA